MVLSTLHGSRWFYRSKAHNAVFMQATRQIFKPCKHLAAFEVVALDYEFQF